MRRFALFVALAAAAGVAAAAAAPERHHAHARIELRIAPEAGTLSAEAILSLPPAAAGEEIGFVLARSLAVASAEAGPNAIVTVAPTERPWGGLQRISVRFRDAERAPRLRVRYAGRPATGGAPPINMITPDHVELSLDGMWVPIREDLGLPFTVDARIAGLPAGATLVGPGRLTRRGGVLRLRRSVPDVDVAFVASPALRRAAGNGPCRFYAADPDGEEASLFRRHCAAAGAFLGNWFGPLPGSAPRLALVRRERKSGYQRIGYIVLAEGRGGSEAGAAKFTAHEFAHSWFRNANATTEHRWVDEATAEYVGLRYVRHALGEAALETLLAPKRERARTAGPVVAGRTDAELYDKGALLLFELEDRIGRERMDRIVARIAAARIGLTEDYVRVVAEVAGPAEARWFDQRLRS
ncbi:MAG TPA: hypothetical protein VGB08_11660 [Allosphingosinicella sp.]|jgi:hypothetical protein